MASPGVRAKERGNGGAGLPYGALGSRRAAQDESGPSKYQGRMADGTKDRTRGEGDEMRERGQER